MSLICGTLSFSGDFMVHI